MQGHYDAVQDRILLVLLDASPAGDAAIWLTRRQWTALAVACDRAGAAIAGESRDDAPRRKKAAAASGPGRVPADIDRARAGAGFVSGIRFRRIPSGLRIEIESGAPVPLALTLKGDGLASFADMVERLAAKAKWDLAAAKARIGDAALVPKRMLH
jgi:hypothetical protein